MTSEFNKQSNVRSASARRSILRAFVVALGMPSLGCDRKPPIAREPGVVVAAAASTGEIVRRLAKNFSASTGIDVQVSVGPSNTLAAQILAGAPVDLFLAANVHWVDVLEQDARIAARTSLVENTLVVAVGRDFRSNRRIDLGAFTTFESVALGGRNTPLGMYSLEALAAWSSGPKGADSAAPSRPCGLDPERVVWGGDAIVTADYVARGDVQAAILYATTAASNPRIQIAATLSPQLHRPIRYPWVRLRRSDRRVPSRAVERFYRYLQEEASREVFDRAGFIRPRQEPVESHQSSRTTTVEQ